MAEVNSPLKTEQTTKKLPKKLTVWNSHGDAIVEIPAGFTGIASTENSDFSIIENAKLKFYGLQFHL